MIDKIAYPTVGRIVLYNDAESADPFPAMVVVASENRYTITYLAVFLHDGVRMAQDVKHKDCVKLARGEPYWDWMGFQKGQAAKTEALQAELERLSKPGRMITDEERRTVGVFPGPVPVQLTADEERRVMAAGVGKAADQSLPEHRKSPKPEPRLKSTEEYNQSLDERYKNESSTPSREDGKR